MTTRPQVAHAELASAPARRRRLAALWVSPVVFCAALTLTAAGVSAAQPAKRTFDIPAGTAPGTLKQFSAQAGGHLLYSAEVVEGARTNAVKGVFTSREVIDRMLAGTGLVAKQDEKTGALAIMSATRADRRAGSGDAPAESHSPSTKKKALQI